MKIQNIKKELEIVAAIGLLLVAIGLVAPFGGYLTDGWMTAFKWIYAAGAVLFFLARFIDSLDRSESTRIRRLHRMESWAGLAFLLGAFFWFYNSRGFQRLPNFHMLGETVAFTMAGAVIQIIAAWMLSRAAKKEK